MSGIVLDIIVVAFVIMMGLLFRKKGFVMALFSFVSVLVSFVAAILLRPVILSLAGMVGIAFSPASPIKLLILDIVIYFAISLGINVLMFSVGRVLNLFTKFPVIDQLNSLLGLILGVLLGILIVSVAFSVIGIADAWINIEKILKIVENSYISKIFYKNNLFFLLQ